MTPVLSMLLLASATFDLTHTDSPYFGVVTISGNYGCVGFREPGRLRVGQRVLVVAFEPPAAYRARVVAALEPQAFCTEKEEFGTDRGYQLELEVKHELESQIGVLVSYPGASGSTASGKVQVLVPGIREPFAFKHSVRVTVGEAEVTDVAALQRGRTIWKGSRWVYLGEFRNGN